MGKEENSLSHKFYRFIESIGSWLTERGEKMQGWALCKMGHCDMASAYSSIVPGKTEKQIHELLDKADEFFHEDEIKAIGFLQEAINLMDPYMIQKYEDGELFLDDQVENEINISYTEVCQSLFDLLFKNQRYPEANDLCKKILKLYLGFSGDKEIWKQHLEEVRRKQSGEEVRPKISRNAPCPCGSGKKYKKCCGKN